MPGGELLLHAEWLDGRARGAYHDAHIPGAVLLDTDRLEDGYPTWRLRSAAELAAVFGACGMRRDRPVAVYGTDLAAACRVWWALRWLGARQASLRIDGLDGWRAAGGACEAVTTEPEPCEFDVALEPHWLATSDDVLAVVEGRSDGCLVDVRSRAEFAGERSGYDYLLRAGRIPGAVHAHVAPLTELLRRGDRAGIADYWQRCGVDFGRRDGVIFHCGSGWRSAVACHAAHLLGLPARNYSDGWCGWSTDYVRDAAAGGQTPGWRQQPSGRPCVTGRA